MSVKSATAFGLTSGLEPGLVLLTSQSFSAVSSQSFNNVFVPTYDFYMVNINWSSTASSNLFVRFRESAADITTNYYGSGFEYAYNNTHANFGAVSNGSTMNVMQTNTTKGSNLVGYFTSEKGSGGSVVSAFSGQGYGAGTGSIFTYASDVGSADGFTIYPTSGTITGQLSLYGVNK
jgi:hypothetical protein